MGRKAFEATDELKKRVEAYAAYGMPQEDMCLLLTNPATGKPIDLKTLHKHFRFELDTGMARANAAVAESLFMQAVGGAAQYDKDGRKVRDEQPRVTSAAIFWAKARMGWREKIDVDHTHTFDLSKLTDEELDLYEKLARKASVAGANPPGAGQTQH